jgi:hypothetical protein
MSNFNPNANPNPNANANAEQAAILQQQRQVQEIIKTFNIADPNHPGNLQSKKKFWVKILLTDFQLAELQQLAQMLGTQPYLDPNTGQPMVDPATGKQIHAIEDTTVASLMKSSALGTYLKYKIDEWQKNAQAQVQQQAQPQF